MSPESGSNFPGCVHQVLFLTNVVSLNGLGLAMCRQDPRGQLQAPSLAQWSTTLGTVQALWKMPIISTQTAQTWRFTEIRAFICEVRSAWYTVRKGAGKEFENSDFPPNSGMRQPGSAV